MQDYILTSEQAREVDRQSIQEFGIPSLVLMERAALALAEVIRHDSAGREQPRILVAAGVGNNGADGLAAARILQGFGYEHISVVAVGNSEKATEEWMSQYYILIALGIPVVFWNQLDKGEYTGIRDSDLIIDALFGIGLKRDISGDYADVIRSINESPAKKYAADIPSGICASTGKVMGCAVKADVTVTFGLEKVGMVLYPGQNTQAESYAVTSVFQNRQWKRQRRHSLPTQKKRLNTSRPSGLFQQRNLRKGPYHRRFSQHGRRRLSGFQGGLCRRLRFGEDFNR